MKLIDLPITLREAAVKNQIAQGNERDVYIDLGEDDRKGNFAFKHSKEGSGLWLAALWHGYREALKYRL